MKDLLVIGVLLMRLWNKGNGMKIQTMIDKLQKSADRHGNIDVRIDYDRVRTLRTQKKTVTNISGPKDKKETFINIEPWE